MSTDAAIRILALVEKIGGKVWIFGDKLRYRLPPGDPQSTTILEDLSAHKSEIRAALGKPEDPQPIAGKDGSSRPAPRTWPTPLPGEPTIAGLPIRRCPVCERQMFWIAPDRPPHCVACGLEEAPAGKEGGAMTQ